MDSPHVLLLFEEVIFGISTVCPMGEGTDVDMTIAYYPMEWSPPTVLQIFCLDRITPPYKFHVHLRRYEIDDVRAHFVWLIEVAEGEGGVESMVIGSVGGEG